MEKFDLIVFGKGLAGLSTAYYASIEGKPEKKSIAVFSKSIESNSIHSQGGIACALSKKDSAQKHYLDTIRAGAGLNGKKIVKIATTEGPKRLNELIGLGLEFDLEDGKIDFGLEACHSLPRVLHINGDQTGKGLTSFMEKLCKEQKNIQFIEKTRLIELEKNKNAVTSAIVLQKNGFMEYNANAIVLATGGYSALWEKTTNPEETAGEAMIAAQNAGAKLKNLEFEQFHPTTLALKGSANFLISESVRGEGGILVNNLGEKFLEKVKGKELAARDVLSREIYAQLMNGRKVFLNVSNHKKEFLQKRFPKIHSKLEGYGISMEKDLIPVEPAAHYSIGGIESGEFGQTNVKGLFAVGECSCSGLHGANRLASNSLLEAIVFGARAGKKAINGKNAVQNPISTGKNAKSEFGKKNQMRKNSKKFGEISKLEIEKTNPNIGALEACLKNILWMDCGIVREKNNLKTALIEFEKFKLEKISSIQELEFERKLEMARQIVESALARKKSIGCHCIY